MADSLVSRHHPVCGFGKIATFVVLRYATNLWKPVPDREIWGGFSIKNGINREKVVNFSDIKTQLVGNQHVGIYLLCAR